MYRLRHRGSAAILQSGNYIVPLLRHSEASIKTTRAEGLTRNSSACYDDEPKRAGTFPARSAPARQPLR